MKCGRGFRQTAARLAIGLGGVPNDPSREAGDTGNLGSQVANGDFHTASKIHRVGLVITLRCKDDAFGRVLDIEKLARGRAVAPEDDFVVAFLDCLHALPDQRRYDMGGFWIEVVALPVEVDRQEEDGVHAILLAVGLALHWQCLLGDPVRRVRLLRISFPEVLLAKRYRRKLWIRANRTQYDRLLYSMAPRRLDELDAHDRVGVEEAAWVGAIGADSTHNSGQMNQNFRPMFHEYALDGIGAPKIVFLVDRKEDVAAAHMLKPLDEMGSEEPGAARDHDALVQKMDHGCLPSAAMANSSASAPPLSRASAALMSASTMMRTSSSKVTVGSQPSSLRALEASAHR